MLAHYACGSPEHLPSRRGFLGGLAAGALGAGLGALTRPAVAADLEKKQKRVLLVWLSGGSSQLETWDPKPGTDTGGPFQAISTSAPGVQICELLPYTAKQMHHLALVRGVNTAEDDHGKGAVIMQTGRRPEPRLRVSASRICDGEIARPRRQPAAPGYRPHHAAGQRVDRASRTRRSLAQSTPASRSWTVNRPTTCCGPMRLSEAAGP